MMAVFNTSLVPVVAVFTKHDQFLRNVEMHMSDFPNEYPNSNVSEAAESQFQEHYLRPLGNDAIFVRLESGFRVICLDCMLMSFGEMHMQKRRCDDLIEKTAAALNQDIIALMLLAVQRDNLQLSAKTALNR
jgi:hypothetical protein